MLNLNTVTAGQTRKTYKISKALYNPFSPVPKYDKKT